ncbi:ATP-binding protein [Collinsella sp. An307]|uniref:ATP-binding protein n=1 Tax=Collinsella sp. An307 TaxID=1965630 RepID=UPI000B380AEF|nr:ATP-binding protein [Collinsella sp. An307]OUO19000.1 hypothetical protein B5F89_08725 [Collinsella sp. An307]
MFVGRKRELTALQTRYDRGGFQFAVVYGRRRVGKTSLLNAFTQDKRTLFFTALEQSDHDNLRDFSAAIARFFQLPEDMVSFPSWTSAIDYLAERAQQERFVLVFDEFPYAVKRNESLPSILQVAIDHKLKHTNLFLALCGSNQGLMESRVLGKKSPLYGRRTIQIKLQQLGYLEVREMLPNVEPQDAFRYYGCFGGVPYYLELIDSATSLRENLSSLYFDPAGFLYDEPFGLLRQELSEPALYSSVLRAIAGGANRQKEIADRTGISATTLPSYLRTLENLSIVERTVPFGKNARTSKRGLYRIRDACYDFWFRFVMPATSSIEAGLGGAALAQLDDSRLDEYLGRRFERLCAEWLTRQAIAEKLPLPVTNVGSWWGTNPRKRAQDDIDVIAADEGHKRLIIGECKYRESFDESAEIADLESKRDLVPGHHAEHLYLFTKYPVSEGTARKCLERTDLHAVSLNEMYEG